MRLNSKMLYRGCPPDKALAMVDSLREDVLRGKAFKGLSGGARLSPSRMQAIAGIFRSTTDCGGLEKSITELIREMSNTTNDKRKDAARDIGELWNAIEELYTKKRDSAQEVFGDVELTEDEIRFTLYREAFHAFTIMFRYREACKEWVRKEETPCSIS